MTLIFEAAHDVDFAAGTPAEGRTSGSAYRSLWVDSVENGARASVWKAEPGRYFYPARALEEVFAVVEGTALCTLDDAEPVEITVGSIVVIPKGTTITLDVKTPMRKAAFVVPKP